MEAYRTNSPTALSCSDKMTQTILGNGLGESLDSLVIKGERLIDKAEDITREIVDECGVFIHIDFFADGYISNFKVIPFKQGRIGIMDSFKYHGKILVNNGLGGWGDADLKKDNVVYYDTFNPEPEVVKSQIKKQVGINKYRGQVLYFNMDRKYVYPLSRIHAVYRDCHNEALASTYKNRILTDGFFGRTMAVTRKLVSDEHMPDEEDDSEDALFRRRGVEKGMSERQEFADTLKGFLGADRAEGVLLVEVDSKHEKLEDAFTLVNLESKINDKLFEYTEKSSLEKIAMRYKNIPLVLITNPDSSMFGTSGEAYTQAEILYQKNVSQERSIVERILSTILSRMRDVEPNKANFIPFSNDNTADNTAGHEGNPSNA